MTVFLNFLASNAQYIYGLCGVVALYFLRAALRARRERRSSIFPLEREVALARTTRTFGAALLLAAVMAATWLAVNRLLPRLEALPAPSTPAPASVIILIDTPTPTTAPPTETPTPAPTPSRAPTRRPTPTPPSLETPPPPRVAPPACPNPAAAITAPGVGQVVQTDTAVTGAANIDGFQFYKLEWSAGGEQWQWFAGSEFPVAGGVLGVFPGGGLPAGAYTIRLVVVDQTGNYPSPCIVQVTVP
ncbi:MAG: hypothetical protein K1X65_20470 [Caldilineales bacterium]|nr:hypothetical protein [Caldilineales bacterium]